MPSISPTPLVVTPRSNLKRHRCPSSSDWWIGATWLCQVLRFSVAYGGIVFSLMMKGRNNGKKLLAVRIVAHAFEIIHLLADQNPIQVWIVNLYRVRNVLIEPGCI